MADIVEEAAAEEIAEVEDSEEPEVEFDIFEQLEEIETPAEEIVLTEPQTIEDLFAEIPTVEEEETVTAHTVVLTEDSVAVKSSAITASVNTSNSSLIRCSISASDTLDIGSL